jgi:four helix bundle protein
MSATDYRDLIDWKKAFELAVEIYRETAKYPVEEKFGLKSQLRRGSVSVPSNIAEGEGRNSKEFLRCLSIAPGSLNELEIQLLMSDALGYLRPGQALSL